MPCIVREMDDDTATILMVDSNIQREDILPSERAQAYKMKLDAIRRKAGRPAKNAEIDGKNNSRQVVGNLESAAIVGQEADDSGRQVQRYIRLTELQPELQQMVDDKKIAMTPAVELSYLKPEEQQMLLTAIDSEQATPSLSQAQRMKKLSQAGKAVLDAGWKAYLKEQKDKPLPDLVEGALLPTPAGEVTEGKTKPPAAYSEDTLLHAMETAGGQDMPEDAERKGIGTPTTRAAMIEKLVAGGFVERKKGRKAVSLVPVQAGISLVTILPEQLQSPLLTAEWEHKLGRIERGELSSDAFLAEITQMVQTLVSEYQPVPGAEVLFPSGREIVGQCPRCGSDVTESKKGFFCEKSDCKFGLWRDNKFLATKRISLTKRDVMALLKNGRVHVTNIFSEKTGKTFEADLLLDDNGERTVYRFDFGRERTT